MSTSPSVASSVSEANSAANGVIATIKNMVHHESSSTLGAREKGLGYSQFEMMFQVWKSRTKTLQRAVRDVIETIDRFAPSLNPADVALAKSRLNFDERVDAFFAGGEFRFRSPSGAGAIAVFAIEDLGSSGVYGVQIAFSTLFMVPAPDYCVVTESKSGFFSSRTTQRIHEFPVALKSEHMEDVMRQLSSSHLLGLLITRGSA